MVVISIIFSQHDKGLTDLLPHDNTPDVESNVAAPLSMIYYQIDKMQESHSL